MPLAHILAPQIARKAVEIAQAVNPQSTGYLQEVVRSDMGKAKQDIRQRIAAPPAQRPEPAGVRVKQPKLAPDSGVRADLGPVGYLQTVGYEKTPSDPRGLMNKPDPTKGPQINPDHPVGSFAIMKGSVERNMGDIGKAFGKGLQKGSGLSIAKDGNLAIGEGARPIPNAPAAPQSLGFTTKPGVVVLPPGAIGMTEAGQPVDKKGKRAGYLSSDPNVVVKPSAPNPDDPRILEHKYRGYLQDMQYDRRSGDMKFPADYFGGMSKQEVDDIKRGVKTLQTFEKGVSI